MEEAIELLREAGLAAKKAARDGSLILGGTAVRGLVFENAFTITPDGLEFEVTIAGPGQLHRTWRSPSWAEAARGVISAYGC